MVEDREVERTHLDKVFYPETGFTKGQVIDYHRRAAPYLLPHLAGRPVTLKRYPEGVAGAFFYEKTCPAHRPRRMITSGGQGGIDIDFCLIDSLPARRGSAAPASQQESLAAYRRKRDFSATPEPRAGRGRSTEGPLFVIQKHAARRLHYDLRLEVEGVLKSWSVPRGPSSNPADRRLAVQVEDHPLSYHDFEGVIPKGQYGAGRVAVWDHGSYRNITGDPNHPTPMARAIEDGKVEIFFEGAKIKGG
jgi:DNA ligase D-like protein (predicted 3'-phosphoesterase)